jgi:hypothetical protein
VLSQRVGHKMNKCVVRLRCAGAVLWSQTELCKEIAMSEAVCLTII